MFLTMPATCIGRVASLLAYSPKFGRRTVSWLIRVEQGTFLVGQHPHHLFRGHPGGEHAADEGSGTGSDVHVEVIDRAELTASRSSARRVPIS